MATGKGLGVKLKITVSAALTVVAKVMEVDFPDREVELEDVTAHDSTGGWAEYIATGLKKMSKINATILWDDVLPTHLAFETALNAGAPVNMSIEDAGGTEILAFAAFITKIGKEAKVKTAYKAKIEIQPTGQPTLT